MTTTDDPRLPVVADRLVAMFEEDVESLRKRGLGTRRSREDLGAKLRYRTAAV